MKPILKKWVRLAAVLAAFAAAVVLAACAQSARPGTVSALLCSPEKFESLQAERTPSETALVTGLSIGGTELVQDSETGVYYYSLPQGAQGDVPSVSFAGENGTKVKILQDFAGKALPSGGTVQLLAYTKTEYQTLQLVCTPLPILSLQVPGQPEQMEKYQSSELRLTLYDNRPSAGASVVQGTGSIHVRGIGSARFDKKGFRFTLRHANGEENDMALLGLRNDGDWILYAGYTEAEKIRQVFTANLWRESCGESNAFGVQNSNEYRYTELFLNGRYWGLYALSYPIDGKQLQVGEGEHTFSKQDFLVTETQIDFDVPAEIPGYEILAGDTVNTDWARVWAPLKQYYKTLLGAQQADTQALKQLADEQSAIDCWLFTNLVQGVDQVLDEGTLYNYRLTTKQTPDGVRILFTPWDFDLTWGAVSAEDPSASLSPQDHVLMTLNPIHKLLAYGDAETLAAVQQRYQALRAGAWSEESLMRMLDECEAAVFASGAYERDYARWPQTAHCDGMQDLGDFRAYVKARLAAMDAFMQDLQNGVGAAQLG